MAREGQPRPLFGSDWSPRLVKPSELQNLLYAWAPGIAIRRMLRPILRGQNIRIGITKNVMFYLVFFSLIGLTTCHLLISGDPSVILRPLFDYLLIPSFVLTLVVLIYFTES
jgi:hypothetical protein